MCRINAMGRSGIGEYYNDNLSRLLREEDKKNGGYFVNDRLKDNNFGSDADRINRGNVNYSKSSGNINKFSHQAAMLFSEKTEKPRVPSYDSSSFHIGERDERRSGSGKIEGVPDRRNVQAVRYANSVGSENASGINSTEEYHSDRAFGRAFGRVSGQALRREIPSRNAHYGKTPIEENKNAYVNSNGQKKESVREDTYEKTTGSNISYKDNRHLNTSDIRSVQGNTGNKKNNGNNGAFINSNYPGNDLSDSHRKSGRKTPADMRNASENINRRQTAENKKSFLENDLEAEENRRLYREYIAKEKFAMPKSERDRKKMEAFYAAQANRRARKLKEFFVLASAFMITLVLISAIVYKLLFVVSDIAVLGDTSVGFEGVIAASGISKGDNLYSFSASAVNSAVTLRYPQIKSVVVKRTIPNKVALTVTDDRAVFYTEIYGEFKALSSDLRVMGSVDPASAAQQGLIKLKLPSVSYAVDGRSIVYSGERTNSYVNSVIDLLLKSDLAGKITSADLRYSYDISMVCDGKYLLKFGDSEEMDIKIKIAAAVLADSLFSGGNKATVDLTNTRETSVIIDNQLVLE